jgi:hypothetical protein
MMGVLVGACGSVWASKGERAGLVGLVGLLGAVLVQGPTKPPSHKFHTPAPGSWGGWGSRWCSACRRRAVAGCGCATLPSQPPAAAASPPCAPCPAPLTPPRPSPRRAAHPPPALQALKAKQREEDEALQEQLDSEFKGLVQGQALARLLKAPGENKCAACAPAAC